MTLSTPPRTPPSMFPPNTSAPPSTDFNIATHYESLTTKDPNLTPALAAIESLLSLLSSNPLTTISETLALLSHQSQILLESQPNPIPLSAGTDLFQRYLISSFQHRSLSITQPSSSDFSTLRNQLISNSRLFVSRAKQAPSKIAAHGLPFIREDSTVFTYGRSNVINTLISHATDLNRSFSCVTITSPASPDANPNPHITPTADSKHPLERTPTQPLNPRHGLPLHAVATAFSSLTPRQHKNTLIIVPATAVLENGAVLSAMGTHTLAILAHSFRIPVYVAVESFKFVRKFPLGSGERELRRLGARQRRVSVAVGREGQRGGERDAEGGAEGDGDEHGVGEDVGGQGMIEDKDMQEIVPTELVTALITENGVMTPAGVSEELIKLWF